MANYVKIVLGSARSCAIRAKPYSKLVYFRVHYKPTPDWSHLGAGFNEQFYFDSSKSIAEKFYAFGGNGPGGTPLYGL